MQYASKQTMNILQTTVKGVGQPNLYTPTTKYSLACDLLSVNLLIGLLKHSVLNRLISLVHNMMLELA